MQPGYTRNIVALGLSALLFASAALTVVPAHCLRAWLAPDSANSDIAAAHGATGHHGEQTMHPAAHMAHGIATANVTTAELTTRATTPHAPDRSSHLAEHPTPQPTPHSGSELCVDCSSIVLSCCDASKAGRSEALLITRDDELTRIHAAAYSAVVRCAVDTRPPRPTPRLANAPGVAAHHSSSPALLGVFLI